MRRRLRPLTPLLVVLAIAIPRTASPQTQITTGVIQGEVNDATGAILPGVTVEAVNTDTNLVQSRVTGENGRFVFLQLPPGRYRVTFTLAGMATVVQEDIVLTVGQALNLNPRMSVSTVQETVTVSGTAGVETSRTAAATTLNQITVETTPILGRKFEDLLTLTPGVSVNGDVIWKCGRDANNPSGWEGGATSATDTAAATTTLGKYLPSVCR